VLLQRRKEEDGLGGPLVSEIVGEGDGVGKGMNREAVGFSTL
jgi:hypothetical protein